MPYYPLGSYVNTHKCRCIGRASENSRYLFYVPFNSSKAESHEDVLVIMLNPSSSAKAHVFYNVPFANLEDIDKTTNNVLNILHRGINLSKVNTKFKSVTLLNLFPYFSPNQRDIDVIYGASVSARARNEQIIDQCLKKHTNGIVLVGWGKSTTNGLSSAIYLNQIRIIKQLLAKYSCKCYQYDSKISGFIPFNPSGKRCYVYHASSWR